MEKKEEKKTIKDYLKWFWNFLWYDDSIWSYIANFVVALIVIKFIFFPVLGFLLGTPIPVVAIVSGSMEHKISHDGMICSENVEINSYSRSLSFSQWWEYCGEYYENNFDLTQDEFSQFPFSSGLNTGDVMILFGRDGEDIDVGDILVFRPNDLRWYEQNGPVIHRVVEKNEDNGEYVFTTKGDRNPSVSNGNFETDIPEDQVYAVGTLRIPYIGYLKVWSMQLLALIR